MATVEICSRYSGVYNPSLALPRPLFSHKDAFEALAMFCHTSGGVLASKIPRGNGKDRKTEIRLTDKPGESSFKFTSAATCTRREDHPDTAHTDSGLLTFLWCPHLSTQISDRETGKWLWIEPKEGCAIVNVGGRLMQETDYQAHASPYRTMQPREGVEERLFVNYHMRPSVGTTSI